MTHHAPAHLSAEAINSGSYVALSDLVRHSMPDSARGALLHTIPRLPTSPIRAVWTTALNPERLRPGAILLSWEPNADGMDVTAHLGLAASEVVLATWPALRGDWTPIVHPTLFEVTALHAALRVATDALHLANHLASS